MNYIEELKNWEAYDKGTIERNRTALNLFEPLFSEAVSRVLEESANFGHEAEESEELHYTISRFYRALVEMEQEFNEMYPTKEN